jgi:hypothetical protein
MDARPDEPQLPLYAVNAPENVSAVAFAKVRRGEMRFTGYESDPGMLPRMTRYDDWDSLLAGWRKSLDALAKGFGAGAAQVDPKDASKTCRGCDLQPLCRVHERLGAREGEAESEDAQ